MKKNDQNHGWEQLRNLPPELELDDVLKHIQTFPISPSARRWTDYLTLKTKWIMLLSALSIFVFLFNFWPSNELVRQGAALKVDSLAELSIIAPQELEEDVLANNVAMLELEPKIDAQEGYVNPVTDASSEIAPGSRTIGPSVALAERTAVLTSTLDRRSSTPGFPEVFGKADLDSFILRELSAMSPNSTATLLAKKENNSHQIAPAKTQQQSGILTQMISADPPLGEPVQSGKWYFVQDMDGAPFIRYRWKEKLPGSKTTWDLVQPLSDLTDDGYGQRMPEKFKNTVGTVYFHGSTDQEQGKFEFYLNPENADRLNAAGAGPSGMDAESLRMTQELFKERFSHQPKDALWFRYFLEDVDNATFDLLADYGYAEKDLYDFWHLIDRGINKVELAKYLPALRAVRAQKIPLKGLARLLVSEKFTEKLLALEEKGHRQLDEEAFNRLMKSGNPLASPPNWGTSCAELGRYDQDLPPFNHAVIKGNIRVVIRKGEVNTMTTIAYPGKEQLVTAEVKDGVLYLTGPKKENRSWNYDIQLTATDLIKVKAKTKTCVWLDGERALSEVEGKLCPTKNFNEWVE